jgi:FtsH-binding integral membrane protein
MLDIDHLIRLLVLLGWLLWLTPRVSFFGISEKSKSWFYLAVGCVLALSFTIALVAEVQWLLQ